jgi:hypothetical protein
MYFKIENSCERYERPFCIFESLHPFEFIQCSFSFLKILTRLPSDAFQLVLTANLTFSPPSEGRFAKKIKGGCAGGWQNASEVDKTCLKYQKKG